MPQYATPGDVAHTPTAQSAQASTRVVHRRYKDYSPADQSPLRQPTLGDAVGMDGVVRRLCPASRFPVASLWTPDCCIWSEKSRRKCREVLRGSVQKCVQASVGVASKGLSTSESGTRSKTPSNTTRTT